MQKNFIVILLTIGLIIGLIGLSAPVFANGVSAEAECKQAGYNSGFFIDSCDGNYKVKLNIKLQPQYQSLILNGANNNVHTFQMRRAELTFSGNVFNPDLTYKFEYEAVGGRDSTAREFPADARANTLRDAYVAYKFNDSAKLKFGQTKGLFTREELTSSAKLQFVGNSIANEVFTFGRDLGVWLEGNVVDDYLDYGVYVTNEGNGQNTINRNTEMVFGGRVNWNVFGRAHDFTMSDVKHSEDTVLTVGLAANHNRSFANGDASVISGTSDVALMYRGFSLIGAGLYARDTTNSLDILGFSAQSGYFLTKKFEVAGRFAGVVPTAAGVVNGWEYTGGLNYFFKDHNLKLQTDYSYLKNSALVYNTTFAAGNIGAGLAPGFVAGANDHRLRTQLSFFF